MKYQFYLVNCIIFGVCICVFLLQIFFYCYLLVFQYNLCICGLVALELAAIFYSNTYKEDIVSF